MEVRPGYKQTEVGIIPKEWDLLPISKLGEIKRGASSLCIQYTTSSEVRLIRINDFFEDNPVFIKPTAEIMKFALQDSDLLFAGTGASAGASYLPPKEWLGLPHSYNAPRIRVFKEHNKELLLYSLQSEYVRRQQRAWFVGNAQPFLDTKAIANLVIAVPSTIDERNAITKALSDVDALLEGLTRLIAKKRDLKQAAMQQLLTGKTRLAGFHGEWMVKRLGEIADIDPEALSSETEPNFAFNYIALEDVDHGILKSYSEQIFSKAPSRARRKLQANDLLVSTVRPNLKSHLLFTGKGGQWVCSTGFCVLRCRDGITHPSYLFFQLFGDYVSRQIDALLTGSNYPSINSTEVRALEVFVPNYQEQTTIAKVLTDMDAELAALEQRRQKTRALKQAMMQELLTGRTRLV